MILWWSGLLAGSLYVLIKGSELFIDGSKAIGQRIGLKPFVIGVLIVGFGTSLPELASSISAVLQGATEIVLANVVGSNITNILLIVGLLAAVGGTIKIKRDLLHTELPIFFIGTVHFAAVIYDGVVDRLEALLLLGTFGAYMWYIYSESKDGIEDELENSHKHKHTIRSVVFLLSGLVAVLVGAYYTIEMTVNIATAFSVPIGLVSIVAIAIGTSLPELVVSIQALRTGETAMAIGNIFGSNAFNIMMVTAIPALIMPLQADVVVMQLGLAVLLAASAIFFVNGLARQIMRWEGLMMLIFFLFFLIKLTEFIHPV